MTEIKRKSYAHIDVNINVGKKDTLKLARLVIHQFDFSLANLDSDNIESIRHARNLSDETSALLLHINQKCISYLTKRKPDPLELKVILTTLKITDDLGLVKNQAESIARRSETFIEHRKLRPSGVNPHITHCASLALDMMRKGINALSLLDSGSATEVIDLYEQVTEEYNFITCSLMDYMLKGPRSISVALDILYVAKSIENVANHARNISHHVIDIVEAYEKSNVIAPERVTENS